MLGAFMEMLLVLDDGLALKQNSNRINILMITVFRLELSSMPIGGLLYDLRFVRLEGSAIHNAVHHLYCFLLCNSGRSLTVDPSTRIIQTTRIPNNKRNSEVLVT